MKRVIVTGGTKSDVAAMGVFAINIRKTNAELFDEIVIFHNGIGKKDQKIINDIFPTRFVEYRCPYSSKNDEIAYYFSYMVFCKYECFRLLKDYDLVVWSDYDVLIQGSLEDICIQNNADLNLMSTDYTMRCMFHENIESQDLLTYNLEDDGICTPLFAIFNSLTNYEEICKWCYEKTIEWDKDLFLPEQGVFGLAVQNFRISNRRIPSRKYITYPENAVGDEIILHAAGQPKFWNGRKNEKWDMMYADWLKLGGSKYSDFKKKMGNKFNIAIFKIKGLFLGK